MACDRCGTENRPGRKFCSSCGASLAVACANCGAANEPGDAFCGECGAALDARTPAVTPPTRAEPTAERRLVSVLFADLVGFTPLSESRDPEDVRELLSRYFDTARRLIGLYGGTVEKFIGDAVMAVWGTPVATEDDAERAVRAGLDLVAAVSALGQEVDAPDLRLRAGVLTGEAAVTLGAEGEGMVAGDLVNTAARIQSAAEPGTVLVGDVTRRACESAIVFEAAGSFELKGKAEAVPLHRAVRVTSGRGGALKVSGLEPPFVGRDRELRLVKELFHASAEERRAHLVSMTGIGGIGKSRLAWEFEKYIDGLAETTYWHRGRCLAYGEGVTYWALADMVRMRCRIAEDDEPAQASPKLEATLSELVLDGDERAFVEPRLAQLLGLAEHGSLGERHDLFAAWRLFFERLADTYPTVLVFEDMQWADASLLDFVEYLLEWSRSSPLYVLTLARPELADRRPDWGAGHRNFTSLYLDPLSAPAVRELLDGLVPGLPEELRERILARAEGVPLYAVETVRMLLDRGLLVQDGAAYRLTDEVAELDVPETLQGLIASRLDGLPADERRLLQDAAVVGKTFTVGALSVVSGRTGDELEPLLSALTRKEVLGVQLDPTSPERGQYGFLQDLVRHVAYETLSRRERRERHLSTARYLETAFGSEDEIAEVVASHYLAASEAVPDAEDAADVTDRARSALVRAADRADSLGAQSEARRYAEQAARLTHDPVDRAALLHRAGGHSVGAADLATAEVLLLEAIEVYETAGRAADAATVSFRLADALMDGNRTAEAIEHGERAYAVLASQPPGEALAAGAAVLAKSYFFVGDVEKALEVVEQAIEIGESVGAPGVLAGAFTTKSMALTRTRPEEAIALLRQAVVLARDQGISSIESRALFNLSDRYFRRDRYHESLVYLEQGLEVTRRRGNRLAERSFLAETTYPLTMTGRWDEALAARAQIPDEALPEGTTMSVLSGPLEIHLWRGDLDEARRLLDAYASFEESSDHQKRGGYLAASSAVRRAEGNHVDALALGVEVVELEAYGHQSFKQGLVEAVEAALALGDTTRAEHLVASIEDVPRGLRSSYLDGQARRFRARLAGDGQSAETSFVEAETRLRELGVPVWLGVTLLEHGEWLAARDRRDEAEPLLAEASEIFQRLEATPWLERAQTAVGAVDAARVA